MMEQSCTARGYVSCNGLYAGVCFFLLITALSSCVVSLIHAHFIIYELLTELCFELTIFTGVTEFLFDIYRLWVFHYLWYRRLRGHIL